MPIRIYVDGGLFDEKTAVIPVFDRGFLYGDSVYEVTRTVGGKPVDLEPHLSRLERSAEAIMLPIMPRPVIMNALAETLSAAGNPDSYIRVIVTRGAGELGLDPDLADKPRLIIVVKPLKLPPGDLYRDGASIAIVGVRRNLRRAVDPAVKSGNYLNNIMAFAEAKRAGAYESIMCNAEGLVVEGSTSNIFAVKDRVIRTPALEDGLLDGITRRRVLQIACDAGYALEQVHMRPDDLRLADELFLTSSVRGVMPVVRVDGMPVKDARPGTVTRELMALYDQFLARVAVGTL
ncbi:MAG: aminotransferase class IV [Deltaproteobacteria bacterium]|nr:aminotransferase class IV [Deltaproteobacteria bacterium]